MEELQSQVFNLLFSVILQKRVSSNEELLNAVRFALADEIDDRAQPACLGPQTFRYLFRLL